MASLIAPVHTRWGDQDVFGHINNVAYAALMEDARGHFLEINGFAAKGDEVGHIVVRHEIDYVNQMEYRLEPHEMELWIDSLGNSSYILGYELRDATTVYMRAKTTMVCLSLVTNRPMRIPADYRSALEKYTRA